MRMHAVAAVAMLSGCVTQGARMRTWTRVQTACEPAIGEIQACTETTEVAYKQTNQRAGGGFLAVTAGLLGGGTLAGLALGGLSAAGPTVKRIVELPGIAQVAAAGLGLLFALGYIPLDTLVRNAFTSEVVTVDTTARPFLRGPAAAVEDEPWTPPPLPEPSAALLPR